MNPIATDMQEEITTEELKELVENGHLSQDEFNTIVNNPTEISVIKRHE